MELGYARVSTTHQDLTLQIDALVKAGISADRIYVDKRTGGITDRAGWSAVTEYARDGDVIVAYSLDRIGRPVRSVLQTIADLRALGVGIRTLADPLPVDTSTEAGPMAEIAVVMLSFFGQMELTFNRERAARARAVAAANGTRAGRKSVVDPKVLAYAIHLRDTGSTMSEIVAATRLSRATLCRHLSTRPQIAPTVTGTAATR
jgi:DNA invertase Pin-like site-specific DNA recombinase